MNNPIKARRFRLLQLLNPNQLPWQPKERINLRIQKNKIPDHSSVLTKPFSAKVYGLCLWLVPSVFCLLHSLNAVSIAATPQTASTNASTSINRPILKVGSQGERVSELQAALKLLGFYTGSVDGVYNDVTASAVSKFKQSVGLNADGIVDASTWQQLFPNESTSASAVSSPDSANKFPVPSQTTNPTKVASPTHGSKPTARVHNVTAKVGSSNIPEPKPATPKTTTNSQKPSGKKLATASELTTRTQQTARTKQNPEIQYTQAGLPILRLGMRGAEVIKLQQRLHKLGFFDGNVDGDFGTNTETAVKTAQQHYGMEADGIVGGGTWRALLRQR